MIRHIGAVARSAETAIALGDGEWKSPGSSQPRMHRAAGTTTAGLTGGLRQIEAAFMELAEPLRARNR